VPYISETRRDRTKVTIEVEEEVIYALSIGAKINDFGWPWRVIMHYVSKHVSLSELTVKIWMKIDLHCQRRRCSPMTLVSGKIRFVPIFEGVNRREGVKRQWGNRKHGFSRLSSLRLQHVKKGGQRYYALLFNPFSPFHCPEIYDLGWLWMAWMFIIRYSIAICLRVIFFLLIYFQYVYAAARHGTWPA